MERGCENCRYKDRSEHEMPCVRCIRNATDRWEPEQDLVEVVRCGKCKNAIPRQEDDFDGMPPYYCPFVSDYVRDNDFCCHGERRNDESD